ncbi:MAG: NAD(P)/FAD-dependent oxidoreductase, partial [Coriobacteriales bacterium]|nr:NAD(P)/FAD-dependent oxidoreductase [Coriobacteriales bacterium]
SGPSAEQAQLTRGGFACDCFDPLTLQAHSHPGLFVAGECLDIDGPCGGYNLHWAWASGLAAGVGAATAAGVAAPSIPAFATHAAFAGTNTNVATVRAAPSRVS